MNQGLKPRPVRAFASQEFPPVTGTGAVTEQSAIDAAKNKEVIAVAAAETEQVLPEPKDEVVTLTASQLESMLKTAIASVTDDVTKKVEASVESDKQTLQAELDKAKSDLATAQNEKATLANVFTALGHSHPVSDKAGVSMPGVNTLLASDRDRETGLFKDFVECVAKADSKNQRTSGLRRTERSSPRTKGWRSIFGSRKKNVLITRRIRTATPSQGKITIPCQ